MVVEIEGKILDINSLLVEERLKALGAEKNFSGDITQDIYVKEGFNGHYRIREADGKIIVTLKTKTGGDTARVKVRDEREKIVDSKERASKDATTLGFSYKHTNKKTRTEYIKDNMFFCIDTYDNTPTFLEIEGPDEQTILEWAKKLGFSEEDVKPWGTKKLIAHYAKQ